LRCFIQENLGQVQAIQVQVTVLGVQVVVELVVVGNGRCLLPANDRMMRLVTHSFSPVSDV
jgi:hypothetical protein